MLRPLGRLSSCLGKVRRRFEANWERVVSRKEIMGAGKAKMVQIGHTMEGVHFVKDVVHKGNIVLMSGEGWRTFQWCSLEACWVQV